ILFGINDRGQIVGTYVDDGILGNERHAFFRDSAGNYTTLDAPGSICSPSPPPPIHPLTYGAGINNRGEIVGFYVDCSGNQHGFFLSAGVWTTIDFPGETNTLIASINATGQIVGIYDDKNGITHGFVGTPEHPLK